MPHLPARFRRSKKDKASKQHGDAPSTTSHLSSAGMLATPEDSSDPARQPHHAAQGDLSLDPLASDDAHAHHDKHDRQGSPPSLSVTATTTPPSSSHSDQSNSSSIASSKSVPSAHKGSHATLHPLKSSFRGFHLRTNKRARSPASLQLQAPRSASGGNAAHIMTASSPLGSSFPASPTSGGYGWNDEYSSQSPKVKLPAFLRLPLHEIEAKFMDITIQERGRQHEGNRDPSPLGRFRSALPLESRRLDRYQNIQPWTNNRVKLKVPEGCLDYVNASPIKVPSPLNAIERPPQNFIAMQGPKRETVEHTWRMIVEQVESPAVIVMLTETHEGPQEKCYPYFPRTVEEEPIEIGTSDEFGDGFRATVRCDSVEDVSDGAIEVRKIIIDVEGQDEDKVIWHLLYRKWPDFGVPLMEDIGSFFELMRMSREKNVNASNPRIVHCSAGVGRSGTFITLDTLMREVDSGELENYDDNHSEDIVFDTVTALREQRRLMVQSEPQYIFIYQVLRQQWFQKYGVAESNGEPAAKRLELDDQQDPFIEE